MPNRLCDVVPSAFRISRWPQPDSCAAWATVNAAGMPLADFGGARRVLVGADEVDLPRRQRRRLERGVALACARRLHRPRPRPRGAASAAAAPLPSCRSSWRAIAAARPPGSPLILFAYWVSSISVPSCVPGVVEHARAHRRLAHALHELLHEERLELLRGLADRRLRIARRRRAQRLRSSVASADVEPRRAPPARMRRSPRSSDDLELGRQRAGRLHRLQDREQVLRRRAERVERLDDVGELRARAPC